MLAKINIILSKCFPHYALIIILERFCVVSIFDYHKEKPPPSLRLHCVCGGRSYGSFIFQKHCELTLKLSVVYSKDKLFYDLTPVTMTDSEFIVSLLNSGCPPISTRAVQSQVIRIFWIFWSFGDKLDDETQYLYLIVFIPLCILYEDKVYNCPLLYIDSD